MRKKWLNSRLMVGLMALSLVVVAGCSNGGSVATVGGEKISEEELNETLVQNYGEKTLEGMIDDKIIELEAKKEKIEVSKKEIDEEFATVVENAGGEDAFKAVLDQNGFTEEQFKDDITQYLTIRKLIEPLVEVTDEEINSYFEENKESFATQEEVEASHILVEDEALAKDIAAQLKDGGDFAALATEHSEDPGSAVNGGELGFFPRGQMMPEFEEAAFSMEVDTISDLVKTDYGFHIIKVTDKKEAKDATLEDSKADIKEALFEEKLNTEYGTWLQKAREEYDIENTLTKEDKK